MKFHIENDKNLHWITTLLYMEWLYSYKILLKIFDTVIYVERRFSKLKFIKSYKIVIMMRTLIGFVKISIENEMLAKDKYTNLISNFASKKFINFLLNLNFF